MAPSALTQPASDSNQSFMDGLSAFIDGAATLTGQAAGAYSAVRDAFDGNSGQEVPAAQAAPPQQATYQPNWAMSDAGFTPNYWLLIGGAILLIIALMMRGK